MFIQLNMAGSLYLIIPVISAITVHWHCVFSAQYDLFAVLVHSGNSASSGHYTALIKDPVTRSIYKFNDTLIEKFTDTKFDISKEEEISM